MSQTTASRVPIGPCQIFWNDVRLGRPKSQATIRHTKNSVVGIAEDTGSEIINRKTGEVVEVDVVIADLKPSQLQYVYDSVASYAAQSTINVISRTATATVTTMRFTESHLLSGVSTVTVQRAGWTSGTVSVFSSDWETEYVSGTDYTSTASVGSLARVSGGDIDDQSVVHIVYTQSATVDIVYGGGTLKDFEAPLKIQHALDNGKDIMFYGYRAKHIGTSDWAIQMAAEFGGVPMTFKLLADESQNPAQQTFYIALET